MSKSKARTIPQTSTQTYQSPWIGNLAYYTILAAIILIPLSFNVLFLASAEGVKAYIAYGLAIVTFMLAAISLWQTKTITWPHHPIVYSVLALLGIAGLATLNSSHPYISLMGDYIRVNGGLLTYIAYTLIFFCGIYALRSPDGLGIDHSRLRRLSQYVIITALIVALLGILEHFGFYATCIFAGADPGASCWSFDPKERVISTLSQPNLLASYLNIVLPVSLVLLLTAKQNKAKVLYGAVALSILACLWFTYSRAGLIGLAVSLVALVGLLPWSLWKKNALWVAGLTVVGAVVIAASFNLAALRLDSVVVEDNAATTNESTAVTRLYAWQGTIELIKDHPWLGIGPGMFGHVFTEYRPAELNQTLEWSQIFDRPHSQILGIIASLGIFGGLAWLSIVLLAAVKVLLHRFYIKSSAESWLHTVWQSSHIDHSDVLIFGFVSGLAGLLASQAAGFSSVTTQVYFYVVLAILVARFTSYKDWRLAWLRIARPAAAIMMVIALTGSYYLLQYTSANVQAGTARGYADGKFSSQQAAADYLQQAIASYESAIQANPYEPSYRVGLATTLIRVADMVQASGQAGSLLQTAAAYLDQAYQQQAFPTLESQIFQEYVRLANQDPTYADHAINLIKTSLQRDQQSVKTRMSLVNLYLVQGKTDLALNEIETIISMIPKYGDGYLYRALYYKKLGQYDLYRADIEHAYQLSPTTKVISQEYAQRQQSF